MDKKIKLAEYIADLLDNKFSILGFKFGLDPIVGLIPGLGDLLTVVFSVYLVILGREMNLPIKEIWRMVWYILADVVVGSIPVAGIFGDFIFKANRMNLNILKKHYHGYDRKAEEGEIVS